MILPFGAIKMHLSHEIVAHISHAHESAITQIPSLPPLSLSVYFITLFAKHVVEQYKENEKSLSRFLSARRARRMRARDDEFEPCRSRADAQREAEIKLYLRLGLDL